jgi:16S rRNA (cytosine1402-N4)-methyltransferase
MRMDPAGGATARDLLDRWDERDLERVLSEYGEEPFARRIARAVVRARDQGRLETTADLAEVVRLAVPPAARRRRIHPATRTFQALRIAVNAELDHLASFLSAFLRALAPGGRAAVLTYHSLEDRLVKRAFRDAANRGEAEDLTRKPLVATDEEVRENPRARSAKLRAVRRAA